MKHTLRGVAAMLLTASALAGSISMGPAQQAFVPVTDDTLAKPDPGDWLMIDRTYDEQRFSPLDQINKGNVGQLRMAFARGLPAGTQESTPIVHDGVMYMVEPGGNLLAVDATNGDLVWEYKRDYPKEMTAKIRGPNLSRAKSLAIVVASPRLVQASCATPRQMSLVNALCRAWETSE